MGRLLLAALVLSAAGGADAQQRGRMEINLAGPGGINMGSNADPSAIVAAEVAFAQLSRDQGKWTGFRKTADKDAVMFVPGAVNAQSWLKSRANPPKSVSWAPDRIFISCDASYAVSLGHAAWPNGRKSRFVTLWRRQQDGSYKWMLDWGSNAPAPAGIEEDMVDGKVADCPPRRRPPGNAGQGTESAIPGDRREWRKNGALKPEKYEVVRIAVPPPANGDGQSRDGTLHWQWTTSPDGARTFKVTVHYGGQLLDVVNDSYAAGE